MGGSPWFSFVHSSPDDTLHPPLPQTPERVIATSPRALATASDGLCWKCLAETGGGPLPFQTTSPSPQRVVHRVLYCAALTTLLGSGCLFWGFPCFPFPSLIGALFLSFGSLALMATKRECHTECIFCFHPRPRTIPSHEPSQMG